MMQKLYFLANSQKTNKKRKMNMKKERKKMKKKKNKKGKMTMIMTWTKIRKLNQVKKLRNNLNKKKEDKITLINYIKSLIQKKMTNRR